VNKWMLRMLSATAILSPLIAYTIWPLHFMDWNDNLIDQGWSISVGCLFFIGWQNSTDIPTKVILKIGFWFAVNNFLDEFLFNPLNWNISEYIYAVIVVILSLIEYKTKKNLTKWLLLKKNKSVS
jgi:hypothetical protein